MKKLEHKVLVGRAGLVEESGAYGVVHALQDQEVEPHTATQQLHIGARAQ